MLFQRLKEGFQREEDARVYLSFRETSKIPHSCWACTVPVNRIASDRSGPTKEPRQELRRLIRTEFYAWRFSRLDSRVGTASTSRDTCEIEQMESKEEAARALSS